MTMRMRWALGALVLGLVLSGCGSARPAPAGAPASAGPGVGTVATAPDGVQEITLHTQDNYVFTPARFTVGPGRVRLTVANVGRELAHNFRFIPGKGPAAIGEQILMLAPGHKETIEFTVAAPGDYPFECSFHVQMGQVGTMTVRG